MANLLPKTKERKNTMKLFRNQSGQGMTEYIIIVALIAIAAIAVFSYFGNTVRQQTSVMTQELAGQDGSATLDKVQDEAKNAKDEADERGLKDYVKSK